MQADLYLRILTYHLFAGYLSISFNSYAPLLVLVGF